MELMVVLGELLIRLATAPLVGHGALLQHQPHIELCGPNYFIHNVHHYTGRWHQRRNHFARGEASTHETHVSASNR